jgi:SAM-dependent methyltransferase
MTHWDTPFCWRNKMATSLVENLKSRDCPVCGAPAISGIPFLDRKIDKDRFNAFSYASRKTPEYMCYRLVRCPVCDVVYASESPPATTIGHAYHQAAYDSKNEALHAAMAYERALLPRLARLSGRNGVLDIGTGSGGFLQRMRENGFTNLVGVEPSRAAIDAADPDIRPCICEGLFSAADFKPASFSVISCFMTLEHVPDPRSLVNDCVGLLKPDGIMVAVVHDWRAWNNRVLGRRAPIIDIEHLQLFSKNSVAELYRKAGFTDIQCRSFRNRYPLDYWNRLLPTPSWMKTGLAGVLRATHLGQLCLSMNVGNLIVVAQAGSR